MDKSMMFKLGLSLVASFGSGWATAVLTDVTPEKAIASGVVACCAYWLGQQQTPAKRQ